MKVLVVVHEFAYYVKGEVIKAEQEIEKILGSHNAQHVVVADHPAETEVKEPAPETAAPETAPDALTTGEQGEVAELAPAAETEAKPE